MWNILNILAKASICLYILLITQVYGAPMIAENTEPGAVVYILPPMPIKEVMDYSTTPGSIPLYKPSARRLMLEPATDQPDEEVHQFLEYIHDKELNISRPIVYFQKVKKRKQFLRKQKIEQSKFHVSDGEIYKPRSYVEERGSNISEQKEQPVVFMARQRDEQPVLPNEDMATAEHNLVFRPLFVYRQQQERQRRRRRPIRYYSTGSYARPYRQRYVKPICYRIP